MEEQTNIEEILLKKKVGTIEKPKATLEAKPVKISTVEIQTQTKEGKKMDSALAHFKCKHPDKDELISISKVKVERDGKLIPSGLWVQLDAEGNIQKSSAIANVLEHLKVGSIEDTYGKDIDTVTESDTSHFLCLKAY